VIVTLVGSYAASASTACPPSPSAGPSDPFPHANAATPLEDPSALIRETARIVTARGLRAVVNLKSATPGAWPEAPEHVFVVGAIDHDWLMPRCLAAVHHGGVGTVGASLRAGLPTMICSVWADQPFWGKLLQRRGLGFHVPFPKLNAATLDEGLAAITRPEARQSARELGARLVQEGDGAIAAARLITDYATQAQATWSARAAMPATPPMRRAA
jgi:sterol 3beta-glucosyltransferase